jgi:hypothetical protein
MHHAFRSPAALSTVLLCAAGALAQPSQFQPMPGLPGGGFVSRADAVQLLNAVVGASHQDTGDEAVLWDGVTGTLTRLGDLPGGPFASEAFAAANVYPSLTVVFGYGANAAGHHEAFRWITGAGMTGLGFLPGGSSSRITGVSYDAQAACGESVSDAPIPVTQAVRWTPDGGMQPLGFLPGGSYSSARAINWWASPNIPDVIVGAATDASGALRPFRWTAADGMQDLSRGQFQGTAESVSSMGDWIVGANTTTGHAFLWTQTTGYAELPSLPGPGQSVAKVADSERGDFTLAGTSGGRACLWTRPCAPRRWSVIDLQTWYRFTVPAGWQLTEVTGAAYRSIAGNGINPSGQPQGWFATLDPDYLCCGNVVLDFDCDGDVGTDFDIEAFFACLAGNCPPCEENTDLNSDGDIGTDADIEMFFRMLGGDCP